MERKPQDSIKESGLWEPLKAVRFTEEKLVEVKQTPYKDPEEKVEREPTPEVKTSPWLESFIDKQIEARKQHRGDILRKATAPYQKRRKRRPEKETRVNWSEDAIERSDQKFYDTQRRKEESLNPRYLQVLVEYGNGLPQKCIAMKLQIAERTVTNYFNEIRLLLGANNNPQALAIAFRRGLIK